MVDKASADRSFMILDGASEGRVSGMAARPLLEASGLPVEMLSQYAPCSRAVVVELLVPT